MENENLDTNANNHNGPEEQLTGIAIDKTEIRDIPIDKIRISEFCRRSNYDDIDCLAQSIDKHGLLEPAAVKEDGDGYYTLIFGSRRYEAHKQLGKKSMRCYVLNVPPAKAAILSFVENGGTEKLHPVEQARKLRLIMDTYGYKEEQIAEEICWNQNTVSECVGILDLDEDILEKIGTDHDSLFKYTHAVALSTLDRTKRFNRKIEVRQLFNKTIEHKLFTKELKALVHLFKDGSYDRLRDALRTYLLTMKNMTSEMARLYLEPEKLVDGEGEAADRRRKVAESLDKRWLESFIIKAVEAGRSFERTKEQLLEVVEDKSKSEATEQEQQEPKSSWKKLLGDISLMQRRLSICRSEVSELAKANPSQLQLVRHELNEHRKKVDDFLEAITDSLGENQLQQTIFIGEKL